MAVKDSIRSGALAIILAAALFPVASNAQPAGGGKPPLLDVFLRPHSANGTVDYVDIRETIGQPSVAEGATLLRMPLVVASIPTQRYDGQAIQARDSAGELPLVIRDSAATSMLTNRDWTPARATTGDVVLTYRASPRVVTATTRNGPLFDLREEAGGLHGAGYTFLALPVTTSPYQIHVHWDLSEMPPGARGIWSLGEGDASAVKPVEILATSYFAAGPIKSYPAGASNGFAMYWLSDPPFDAPAAGAMIETLFNYTSNFFHDEGGSYRVFIRKQPYKGNGGTALYRSFMFGYGAGSTPTVDSLEGLIAHEMVHNWPALDGDHADTSWYSEGTAEYYSILLSYRAGLITPSEFLNRINERASGYYSNPRQTLTNRQADDIYWKDAQAQRVPYGRGFMYLAIVDAQIRATSKGARSLDNLVLEVLARRRRGEHVGPAEWKALVAQALGPTGAEAFDAMTAGKRLTPPLSAFAPCFHPVGVVEHPVDAGFDVASLSGAKHVVRGLIANSPAAVAGLRNGDEVVQSPDFGDPAMASRAAEPVSMKIRRDGHDQFISFVPSGPTVEGYHWARNRQVPDSACKI